MTTFTGQFLPGWPEADFEGSLAGHVVAARGLCYICPGITIPIRGDILSKVHTGRSDLQKAFNQHGSAYSGMSQDSPSRFLLLFYTVECGLKYAVLTDSKKNQTDYLFEYHLFGEDGHDLLAGVKNLPGVPHAVLGPTPVNIKSANSQTQHPFKSIHQLWRYGIRVEKADEKKAVEWLESLYVWLKGEYI